MPYLSIYQGMEDEAVTVLGADRLLQGEWPYLDWDTRHTPGSYFLCAGWFLVVGTSMFSVRMLMVFVAALLGLLQYRLVLPSA